MNTNDNYLLPATELHSLWLTNQRSRVRVSSIPLNSSQRTVLRFRGYTKLNDGSIVSLCCSIPSKNNAK